MASALIKEELMVAALKLDARGDNATKLATGALLVILDAYDRKVTRQAFVAMATAALTVNDNIGRVCAMQAILDAVDQNGRLSLMDIQLAKADVDSYLKHSTEELQKAAYLLTQLPEDGDRVQ